MARIAVIFGTRPEIIRLARVVKALERNHEVVLINTRQNFERNLSDIFLSDLEFRKVDFSFTLSTQGKEKRIKEIQEKSEDLLRQLNPDCVLILGDTYSGLSAISAKSLGIPVYHMEAGNRCYSSELPEEFNRVIIDNNSKYLLPYTEGSRSNLIKEGFSRESIYVTGNPIYEVLCYFESKIDSSSILETFKLEDRDYLLCTMHRAEGIDVPERLSSMLSALKKFNEETNIPVLITTHPRLKSRLDQASLEPSGLNFLPPLNFFDFIKLEKNALLVATDSGTVQEEACIFGVPAVTLREVTERPETIECGSNELVGYSSERIFERLLATSRPNQRDWKVPDEYLVEDVSERVSSFIKETVK